MLYLIPDNMATRLMLVAGLWSASLWSSTMAQTSCAAQWYVATPYRTSFLLIRLGRNAVEVVSVVLPVARAGRPARRSIHTIINAHQQHRYVLSRLRKLSRV
jgi:hypothetical protein